MSKRLWLILFIAILYLFLRLNHINLPITAEELELASLNLRIISIFLGILLVMVFLRFVEFFKNDLRANDSKLVWNKFLAISLILFIISPWLIQINLFSLKSTLSISFFLISVIFLKKKLLLFLSPLFIFLVLNLFSINSLINQSILYDMIPRNFLWQIDRRLAYSMVEEYSPKIGNFDLGRIVHNKPTYFLNNLFIDLATPLNLEKISSPLQAHSPTSAEISNYSKLPKIFFFEIPLIFLGVILLLRRKSKILTALFIVLFWVVFFYKSLIILSLLAPFLVIFETMAIYFIINSKWKLILYPLLPLFIIGQFALFDLMKFHPQVWMGNQDFAQWQIWKTIEDDLDKHPKIIVTDRLGSPESYFRYYINKEKQNINTNFKSFKYLETDRRQDELWVGLPGEFVGAFGDFKKETNINDGLIVKKIKDIKQADKSYGDEIWIVITEVKK